MRNPTRSGSSYESAMTDYLSRGPTELKRPKDRYPQRDELHDRAGPTGASYGDVVVTDPFGHDPEGET